MKKDSFITCFQELQDIQAYFCHINRIKNTPELVLEYLFEEMRQLARSIKKGDAAEIGESTAEMTILLARLANCYPNISLEREIIKRLG